MIKKDLRCGMVVELRNGTKCYYNNKSFIRLDGCGLYYIDLFNYDLTRQYFLDVVKVYKDYTLKELLWQRKEKLKLAADEKVILRNIDKQYKYIARDEDGNLHVYKNKPYKRFFYWSEEFCKFCIFNHLFKFIKFEDKEPYLISDLLKG